MWRIILVITVSMLQCGYPDEYSHQDPGAGSGVYGIEVYLERWSINTGETTLAGIRIIKPEGDKLDADSGELSWSVEDGSVARIDAGGKISGINPGETLITGYFGDYSSGALLRVEQAVDFSKVMISEIFYDAEGSDSGYEFIEIYNGNDIQCDLSGFSIHDGNSGSSVFIFPENSIIEPMEYLVISQDGEKIFQLFGVNPGLSGLNFSLNNSGETLSFVHRDMRVLDKIYIEGGYSSDPSPGSWGSGNLPEAAAGESVRRVNFNNSSSFSDWMSGSPTPGY